jgi:hypothetical protein
MAAACSIRECAIPTHGGRAGIGAAAAAAASVSAAVEGYREGEVLAIALRASADSPTICGSLERIHSDLATRNQLEIDKIARRESRRRCGLRGIDRVCHCRRASSRVGERRLVADRKFAE